MGLDPAQVVVKKREEWEVGYGDVDANASVREAVCPNPTRSSVQRTALPGWSVTVDTAVCAPTAGCVKNAEGSHVLTVPAGSSVLRVVPDWGNPAFNLDLEVYNPAGHLVGSSGQGISVNESVSIPNPVAGKWRVMLKGHLNAPTTYTGTAEVDRIVRQ